MKCWWWTLVLVGLTAGVVSEVNGSAALFPYGPEAEDAAVPKDSDDTAAPEFRLKTPIKFFHRNYESVYINQNGLISFLTDIPTFVNIQFPLDYPSIAVFYSDVDVREAGDVFYRESQDEALLERAGNLFKGEFSKAEGFEPKSLLIVTWAGVGHFDRQTDKLNTYQLVVASDGTDSYAVLQYEKLEWIQGKGKNPSLPDARAQAGIISGHGPYHTLKGSGTDQISSLHKRSNFGEPGSWAFKISDEVTEPDLKVNGGSSSETSASCATAATSCHSKASCIDYDPGFCCACGQDAYGNGRVCLQKDVPVRVSGKVRGVLNSAIIDDSDLFSYVLPEDGRAYTAISKIPERLGYDLQTVTVLGTIIGWLFSTSEKGAPNGFTFTGGVMNYTAEISFYQTGQKVTVNQHHMGLDVFNSLRVDTRIYGATPVVPIGKFIELNDFEMKFTRVNAGLLRSRSTHYYRVDGTSQENPFSVEQTIEYNECPWAAPVPPELGTLKTMVGRNYIIYDPAQQISRFATTTSAEPVEADPCQDNKDKCGPNSSCVVEGSGYKCICDLGYEQVVNYEEEASGADEASVCVDVDECRSGKSNCDATAICINTPGSYKCECRPGYSGDGFACHKVLSCSDVNCAPHAECVEVAPGVPECRCLPDYYGNGLFCYPRREEALPPGATPDCRQLNICDPFAECVYSPDSNTYGCKCRRGYTGDGEVCIPQETESCEIENNCHVDADCKLDPAINEYVCNCRTGFVGDGYTCRKDAEYQSPTPVCDFFGDCQCPPGWEFDDIKNECVRAGNMAEDYTCEADPQMCDANANCERTELGYTCVCRAGFSGDGRRCTPQDACSSHAECSQYGFCTYDTNESRYICKCKEGFEGNGKECSPTEDFGCDILRNCDVNANCVWDTTVSKNNCECNPGYIGDGITCEIDKTGCNYLQNCHRNAECLFDSRVKSYRCFCKQGFEGDGLYCRSDRPCYEDRSVCDPNAECSPIPGGRDWKCQCRDGFTGNGIECKEAARRDGSFLLVTKGMSIIKVPTTGEGPVPLAVEPFQTAVGIDVDCPSQVVYWGDVGSRTIKQVAFNGTGKSNFLSDDIGSPEGLSVDWAARTVYWTDSQKDTIEVAHLDTKMRKTIISKDLVNPRGIAVYSQRGRLFWSDWNRKQPKIEFSGLDGQDREILVTEGLALPNSLIVDPETDSLCWADADTHQIECIGIDGRNRRVMITGVKYPFGLALSPEHFYWTDWTTRKIESAGKITGKAGDSINVPLGGIGKLYGLVFVPPTCVAGYSPCAYNPCSENKLCLQSSRGSVSCVCPEGASSDCQDSYN